MRNGVSVVASIDEFIRLLTLNNLLNLQINQIVYVTPVGYNNNNKIFILCPVSLYGHLKAIIERKHNLR